MAEKIDNKNKQQDVNKETVVTETTPAETVTTESATGATAETTSAEATSTATTSTASEQVYEDYEADEVAPKPKKKHRLIWIILILLVLVIAGFVVIKMNGSKNQVMFVDAIDVPKGEIENILSVSGTVQSSATKTYFADVSAPVSEINVKVGDKIKAGDVIYTYDEESLNLSKQTAELSIKQAQGTYSSYYSGTAAADRKYAEGMTPAQINARLDAITAEIDALNAKITDKTNRVNQTIKDIQNTMKDVNQNGIDDSYEMQFANGNTDYIYRTESEVKENGEYREPTEQDRQMILAMSQTLNDVQYKLNTDEEIRAWKDQITALQEEQAHLQSGKASQLNPGTMTAAKAQKESTELTNEDAIAKIDEALGGVKADFNAVVTAVSVVEGATVAKGTQTVTLASTDEVEVAVQISKSDLPKIAVGQQVDITINNKPYSGTIAKISGSATKNNNGVAVVETIIKVTNPDSDIILGVEANNKIHAQKAENTLVLPYEYVQTDSEGDYVYVVENGVVTRHNVTIGIASSTEAQIVDGIKEGDKIITSGYDLLKEGMAVQIAQNQ